MNSPRETPTWVLWGVLALFIAVYSPILYYMALHWKIVPDYSHGFLIVPLAIYFAWQRKPLLEATKIGGTWWGLLPLALGLAALAVGRLGILVGAGNTEIFTHDILGLDE